VVLHACHALPSASRFLCSAWCCTLLMLCLVLHAWHALPGAARLSCMRSPCAALRPHRKCCNHQCRLPWTGLKLPQASAAATAGTDRQRLHPGLVLLAGVSKASPALRWHKEVQGGHIFRAAAENKEQLLHVGAGACRRSWCVGSSDSAPAVCQEDVEKNSFNIYRGKPGSILSPVCPVAR
jgi:hypothetical protein